MIPVWLFLQGWPVVSGMQYSCSMFSGAFIFKLTLVTVEQDKTKILSLHVKRTMIKKFSVF